MQVTERIQHRSDTDCPTLLQLCENLLEVVNHLVANQNITPVTTTAVPKTKRFSTEIITNQTVVVKESKLYYNKLLRYNTQGHLIPQKFGRALMLLQNLNKVLKEVLLHHATQCKELL